MEVATMPEVILAVLGRPEAAASVLHAAQGLATLVGGAGIHVLAVGLARPDSPLLAESLMAEATELLVEWERDQARIDALKQAFDGWAAATWDAGASVHWNATEGAVSAIVEERGRGADFVVIARPGADDDAATRHAFQAALFHTERPVLVVPAGGSASFGRAVAIAWRDDKRAVKAVVPVLRFLARAGQVHLLAGVRAGAAPPTVPEVLTDHGVSAELHILPIGEAPFGKAVLAKAHELGADLLVMGAYAHSPLREMILGGMTRYLLEHADLPLLMRH
jgi:nucleotide-binding universal stress UspA family protein